MKGDEQRELITDLIEFSLSRDDDEAAAQKEFPTLDVSDIRRIYGMHRSQREEMLAKRRSEEQRVERLFPERYRNPEQAEKLAQINSDPANR
jgi:hypothetical protein